jgi:gluconokinase
VSAVPVVVGVDIGTSATKVVAYDAAGSRRGEARAAYPLEEPQPGEAVQDPHLVLAAVLQALGDVAAQAKREGAPVHGVCFSSAMHSLIGLDAAGVALTPSITWADLRAIDQAERLRDGPAGRQLHRRTGTPVHPMSPLAKLVWFREREPSVFASAARWLGIKEFVIAHLSGEYVMDLSIASGSGLLDLASRQWWRPALDIAGIDAGQLPPVVATTQVLSLRESVSADLGLAGVPVIIGAGDGPLANLGVGAIRPGVAGCSIGTSGAMRVTVGAPGVDPGERVFCYALTEDRWSVGGAISNGGAVLQWAGDALAPDLAGSPPEVLVAIAAQADAGSDGLLMLPYLLSERAPHWSALARGAYVGLTRAHGRPQLIRAALEGVCQQLALVLQAVRAAGNEVHEIRGTGGFLREAFTRQLLADVLGAEIRFTAATEGSAFGAALLGMQALGLIESLDVAADLVPIEQTRSPQPWASARYEQQRSLFDSLYQALAPAFLSMHRIH